MKSLLKHKLIPKLVVLSKTLKGRMGLNSLMILAVLGVYIILFNDNNRQNRFYYSTALQKVYTQLASNYNINTEESAFNSRLCFSQDYFKLTHPDIILDDVYCLRMVRDSIQSSYNQNCFTLSRQSGLALQNAQKSLAIYHGYPLQSERKDFMTTRCIFQTNMALQVTNTMTLKSKAQWGLTQYQKYLIAQNASQACLKDIDFCPKSFSLNNRKQCQEVIEILRQKFDLNNTQQDYILKSNIHLGQGLWLIKKPLYKRMSARYKNGTACGRNGMNNIVQEMVNNPVLLDGRKLDFRIWFLVIQAKPLIMYIYDYTGIMTCFDTYDQDKLNPYNFNCNSGIAHDYWKNNKTDAIDPLTIEDIHQGWSFKDWGQYLKSIGLVKSDDWWRTDFLPQIETLITYYMKILLRNPKSDQRLSALYAFDASINRDLQVKLFDFNTGPNFLAITPGNIKVQDMLHKDTFKLLQLYIQQRYNGLKTFLNDYVIPRLKQQQPIDQKMLEEILKVKPIPERQLFQWFLIDQQESIKNCKAFDSRL